MDTRFQIYINPYHFICGALYLLIAACGGSAVNTEGDVPDTGAASPALSEGYFKASLEQTFEFAYEPLLQEAGYSEVYIQLETDVRMNELLAERTIMLRLTDGLWDERYYTLDNAIGHLCSLAPPDEDFLTININTLYCQYPEHMAANTIDGTTILRLPVYTTPYKETAISAIIELPETVRQFENNQFTTDLIVTPIGETELSNSTALIDTARTLLSLNNHSQFNLFNDISTDCSDGGTSNTLWSFNGTRSSEDHDLLIECSKEQSTITGHHTHGSSASSTYGVSVTSSFSDAVIENQSEVVTLDGRMSNSKRSNSETNDRWRLRGVYSQQTSDSLIEINNTSPFYLNRPAQSIIWKTDSAKTMLTGQNLTIQYWPIKPQTGYLKATNEVGDTLTYYLNDGPDPSIHAAFSNLSGTTYWALPLPEGLSFDLLESDTTPIFPQSVNTQVTFELENFAGYTQGEAREFNPYVLISPRALQQLAGHSVIFNIENAKWDITSLPSICKMGDSENTSTEFSDISVNCTFPNPISIVNSTNFGLNNPQTGNSLLSLGVNYERNIQSQISLHATLPSATGLQADGDQIITSITHDYIPVFPQIVKDTTSINDFDNISATIADLLTIGSGEILLPLERMSTTQACDQAGAIQRNDLQSTDLVSRAENHYINCQTQGSTLDGSVISSRSKLFSRQTFTNVSIVSNGSTISFHPETTISITSGYGSDEELATMAVNTFGTLQTVSDTGVVKEIINFNSQCSFQKNDQNDDNLISVQTSEDISYLPESINTEYSFKGSVLGGPVTEHFVQISMSNNSVVDLRVSIGDSPISPTILSAQIHLTDQPSISYATGNYRNNGFEWTAALPAEYKFGCEHPVISGL